MFKRYSFLVLSFLIAFTINAQQDPLAVEFSGTGTPMPGSTYDVDVRVSDFDQLSGAQFIVGWDSLVLEVISLPFITQDLTLFDSTVISLPSQTASMTRGQIRLSWFNALPQSLPDDHLLFTMRFNVIGTDCDSTQIGIVEFPPNSLTEVYDQNFENIGATFQGHDVVIPGTDCGGGGGGTMIDDEVGLIFPDVFAAPGENICLPFTTVNFDSVETFQGSLMWDPDVLEYTGVQNFALPGMSVGSFNTSNTASGITSFVWFDNTGVTPASLPDNSTIFEICFDVIGSNGESSIVKAFDGATSIQISSPFPTGVRDHIVVEGSVTIGENVEGQEFSIKADTVDVEKNAGEVCVDFSTLNFNDVAGMQYTLQWDETILEYNRVEAINPVFSSTFNLAAPDRLRYSWTNPTGVGLDLPDGEIIYQVCFDIIGDCDESTVLEFIGEPGRPIEIVDGTFNPLPANQVMMMNGLVNIICGINLDATVNNVRCNDESNGSIVLNITGGTGPYDVDWEWSNGGSESGSVDDTYVLPGLESDTYCVTVTDMFGDTSSDCYTVEQPDPLEINVTVNGSDVDIDITGGNMPYTQEINPPLSDPAEDGTYTILVTDDRGCQETAIFVVGAMCDDPVSLSTVAFSAICGDDGRIEVTCSGGSGNYDITSNPALTFSNGEFINVPVGSYEITCVDADNPACTETATVQVLQGAPDDLELVVVNVSDAGCDGSDGSITLGVTGGCEPYDLQYSYEGGSSESYDPNAGYPAGNYEFTLTDDAGTVVNQTITVGESSGDDLEAAIVSQTDAPCTGMDGTVTISLSGGCGNIDCDLMISGGSPQDCGLVDNGDGTFTGSYPVGSHTITFTDDFMGATSSVSFDVVVSGDALSANVANVGTNSIDIDVSGGIEPYQFFWMDPNGDAISGNNEDLSGLTVFGTYDVTIVDDQGCSFALSVTLTAPGEFRVDVSPVDEPFDGFATPCAEGECMGVISAATVNGVAPYTITLTDENLNVIELTVNAEGDFDIMDLCAGSYQLDAVDANGAEYTEPNSIIISSPAPIVIGVDELNCPDSGQNNGSVSATVSGGTGLGYIYTWSPDSGDPIPGPTNEDLGTGVYTLTVEDSNGCETSFSFDLLTDCIDTDCFIGKRVITPNADGANDLFAISCASDRGFRLRIFDRWGVTVYTSTNYQNDWDGIADDGDTLPEGAYHWVLETDSQIYSGVVTLLRD